ncbi:S66 peptidase family protein [Flindersiella endophytica]
MSGVSRRTLLTAGVAAAAAAPIAAGAGQAYAQSPVESAPGAETTPSTAVRPPALKAGDLVRVVSPASKPTESLVARGVEILESWGLRVELGDHVFDKLSYLAGTDADRLADLNAALRDPEVKAVFASRGGAGATRIVEGMDFAAVRADPKPLIGFSDITVLQLALWARCRVSTIHGPMMNWDDSRTGPESAEALRAALMTTAPVTLKRSDDQVTAPVEVPGRASGLLLGGNLSMIAAAVGSSYFPSLRGAILVIEDTGEPPYHVDRFLTQIDQNQGLRNLAGVAVGQFIGSTGNPGDWTIVDLLRDKLGNLGIPVLGGLLIGHGSGQLTVPFGTHATLDTQAGTLTAESGVR